MSDRKLNPITDPAIIAAGGRKQDATVAEALSWGLCAHASIAVGIVCVREYGHAGRHAGRGYEWGEP